MEDPRLSLHEGHDLGHNLHVGLCLLGGREPVVKVLNRLKHGAEFPDAVPVLDQCHELRRRVDGVRRVDVESAVFALPLADDVREDLVGRTRGADGARVVAVAIPLFDCHGEFEVAVDRLPGRSFAAAVLVPDRR